MRKSVDGSLTIEAAVIVPILLWVFAIIITLLFYFHDKNVVTAIAHETAVIGCGEGDTSKEEVEKYFQRRLSGKLLLFTGADVDAKVSDEMVSMQCSAKKENMKLQIEIHMCRTEPETVLRRKRLIGEWYEDILQK